MTPATLIVPLDVDDHDGERARNWRWLANRYRALHPGWPAVIASDPGPRPFAKARAVNTAVARAHGDVLVIVDADVVPDARTLIAAVEAIGRGLPWVVPFGDVYRLSAAETARVVEEEPPALEPGVVSADLLDPYRPVYRGKPGGGVVVVARAAFDAVGGMDERFVGWGGEDYALGYALDACIGPPHRDDAPLWHLWHPPQPEYDAAGKLPEPNRRLIARYRRARRDAGTMRELLDDRGGDHVGCGCNGVSPDQAAAPRAEAKCLTCGLTFVNYDDTLAHKNATGHVIEGLRGLRAASRRETVDPFVAGP